MRAPRIKKIKEVLVYEQIGSLVPCRIDLVTEEGRVSKGGGLSFMKAFLVALEVGKYGIYNRFEATQIIKEALDYDPAIWTTLEAVL